MSGTRATSPSVKLRPRVSRSRMEAICLLSAIKVSRTPCSRANIRRSRRPSSLRSRGKATATASAIATMYLRSGVNGTPGTSRSTP